ncbi:Uridine kinase [Mesoplasma sp. JKS002658]|uniref:uridine kinase n=1 Tax=Mesoplasma whartonense TaxID=2878854 RepID=UPI002022AA83|nr:MULTISPECIES: uridine kinase [unclassified Mesoplasma]MCL8211216.1 Uridine kinase [Mesoplasma sp. JKS002664]MCL8211877.1 Uridine kinase [Mesoplasma sp. JKS002662]MCL8214018.1 Uridine kinase [Mesoplasma sp. JKS002658]MCL8214554.1 Uridine kinase [Mesoplasma sp. JKS002663]MCL8215337.1 Uridine kinase [Mesoplasma sp. JKS002659]
MEKTQNTKKPVTIIIIAGGSGSGKTTVATKISQQILKDKSVEYLSMDNYYNDLSHMDSDERDKVNFDHPNALDVELLEQHLMALKNRETIEVPQYDFKEHVRDKKSKTMKAADVIILDGILALHIESIRDLGDIKLFIKTADDVRFIRRLERDVKERGRTLDSVIEQYLNVVRPMHQFFVEPSIDFADLIVPYYEGNDVAVDIVATKIASLVEESN